MKRAQGDKKKMATKVQAMQPADFYERLSSKSYTAIGSARKAVSKSQWSDKTKKLGHELINKFYDKELTAAEIAAFTGGKAPAKAVEKPAKAMKPGKKEKKSPVHAEEVVTLEYRPTPSKELTIFDELNIITKTIDLNHEALRAMNAMPENVDISEFQRVQNNLAMELEKIEVISQAQIARLMETMPMPTTSPVTNPNERPITEDQVARLREIAGGPKLAPKEDPPVESEEGDDE